MTSQASGVVILGICHEFLVWIMTGCTTDSFVLMIIALAFEDSIGLEPNIFNAANSQHLHLDPGTMARAAKLGLTLCIELTWIEDIFLCQFRGCLSSIHRLTARLHRHDMFFSRAVTPFAGDSGSHFVQS